MASHPLPPVPPSPPSGGVRRYHTISSSSRAARANAREAISEETQEQQLWHDDDLVDQDWIGGVGAVGEKSSLHRQSSLPTRYHRGLHVKPSRSGSATPKTLSNLTTIAGHEGDEEDWERDMRGFRDDEEVNITVQAELPQHQQVMDTQSIGHPPLSPHFNASSHLPSPPPAGSGVRRHQSLTYGVGGPRQMPSSLKRAGTLQGQGRQSHTTPAQTTPSPPDPEEEYNPEDLYDEYEDNAQYGLPSANRHQTQSQVQYPTSPRGRSSPWNASHTPGEWRNTGGPNSNDDATMDAVRRALSDLEIASTQIQMRSPHLNVDFQTIQPNLPPRHTLGQSSSHQMPNMRGNNNGNGNGHSNAGGTSRSWQIVPEVEGRKTPVGAILPAASAYTTSVGQPASQQHHSLHQRSLTERDDRLAVNSGSGPREQKDRVLSGRTSNPNLHYSYQQLNKPASIPSVPAIPPQYLNQQQSQQQQQQQQQQHGQGQQSVANRLNAAAFGQDQLQSGLNQENQGYLTSSIDVPSLIATKGYNPANFDIRPQFARYFVIKSYTEDDVHKSLKYEIWSSTDPGNKRLDKAFKETSGRGPIYLFFSVNASGHFCGMAEMLTPVDYTRSSTVWASDKWKGVFKVRWIFVRDIPNVNLRHIRLNNTQERKPVTNSRDTQELLPDAGQEMLRIFHTHPARTSLLQDFAFYELQAMQKIQTQGTQSSPTQSPNLSVQSPQPQSLTPGAQLQTNPFNMLSMTNPNTLTYQMPQMTPMMQMQMQMNMGLGSQFGGIPQTQAMHQSVLRHSSPSLPGPLPVNGQNFMGMPSF